MLLRAVVFVPDLFRDKMSRCGEAFQPADVLPNILARGQFVMAPFSRKKGPTATLAGAHERPAVLALTVSVIVVASPAGARWRLHLKRGIHHSNRIADHRIVRRPNAIADQFEETRINDFSRRIRAIEALGSVVHRQREPPGTTSLPRLGRPHRIWAPV